MKITCRQLRQIIQEELSEDEKKDPEDSKKKLGKSAQRLLDILDKFDDEEARRLDAILRDAIQAVQPAVLPDEIAKDTVRG